METKNILVTGIYNSGTTWTGHVLSSGKEVAYIHEPFNINRKKRHSRNPIKYQFHYVLPSEKKEFKNFIQQISKFYLPFAIHEFINRDSLANSLRSLKTEYLKSRHQRKLFKDPVAFFSAPFFSENDFDCVVTVKHPAAFVASIKKRNWIFDFNCLLNQDFLMKNILYSYKPKILEVKNSHILKNDIIENGILIWNIFYSINLFYQKTYPNWHYIKHEDFSQDPFNKFKELFKKLKLTFSEEVEQFIRKSTNPNKETDYKRKSNNLSKTWTTKLTRSEILRIYEGTKNVAGNYYSKEEWFDTIK